MKNNLSFLFASLLIFGFIAGQTQPYANQISRAMKQTNRIVVTFSPPQRNTIYYIYYRTQGMKSFQIRKMKADSHGTCSYQIPTENLYGRNLEYFINEEKNISTGSIAATHIIADFTQKEFPEIYFQDPEAMAAPNLKRGPLLNASASLSTSTKVSDNSKNPDQNYAANGNLRIFKNISDNDYQFDFDINFAHIDPRSEIENRLNLSSMLIRFKKGAMQFEVGDIAVNETEFSTSSLNRRGLRYELANEKFYLNTFYTNSQQKTGFDGFGIPDTNSGIFGAAAGFNLKNTFKIRGMFMAGKDNLDSKTVSSNESLFRAGEMFSLWGELNLLKSKMQLLGEFSSSNFGSATDKENLQKEKDTAWQAGLKFNTGIFSLNGDYKKVGDRFNSIANLFLQNDREGLNSNVALNIKSFSWTVAYIDQKNYLHSPVQDMLHEKKVSSAFNWGIGPNFRVSAELSRDNLDYDSSTGMQTSTSNMNTNSYSASLGYMAGASAINISVGKTESLHFTSNMNGSIAINLKLGEFMSLNPSLNYQSNKNLADGSTSTIYNFYLNSEITFVPQYLTLTLSTSYMNNKGLDYTNTNWSFGGNLNFFMAQIFKNKIRPSLIMKSQFQGSKYGDQEIKTAVFLLQADISF